KCARPQWLTVALLNGEIAMAGVSGEFFSNHSIRLKELARVKQLFFFGYCNGYHQYFPTIEAVAEGGYGADNQVSLILSNRSFVLIPGMWGRLNEKPLLQVKSLEFRLLNSRLFFHRQYLALLFGKFGSAFTSSICLLWRMLCNGM